MDTPHAIQACLSSTALLSRNRLLYVNCDMFDHIASVLQGGELAMSICHHQHASQLDVPCMSTILS